MDTVTAGISVDWICVYVPVQNSSVWSYLWTTLILLQIIIKSIITLVCVLARMFIETQSLSQSNNNLGVRLVDICTLMKNFALMLIFVTMQTKSNINSKWLFKFFKSISVIYRFQNI